MEELHIEIEDTYLNVIKFGTGKENLVIIAGVSLTGLEGQGQGIQEAYQLLSSRYTIYVVERRKEILSTCKVIDMAEDIYFALNKLGVKKTTIYGVSQGGMIGQLLAIYHPELVDKLIVCSSMCKTTPQANKVASEWVSMGKKKNVVDVNRSFFKYVYSQKFMQSVKDMLPQIEKQGTPEDCERFAILAKNLLDFDITDLMDKIKCRCLVLGDKNDLVFGPEGSYDIAKRIDCEFYMYENYSHAVYDEAPEIKERILAF